MCSQSPSRVLLLIVIPTTESLSHFGSLCLSYTNTHTHAYKHTHTYTHRLQLANGFDQGKTVSQEATLHIDENHCDFVASLHVRAGVCESFSHALKLPTTSSRLS